MQVIVAERAGTCYGVQRALESAHNTRREATGSIYTIGPLIHNPQVVKELEGMGILVVEDPSEIDEGTVIIRSHGISPGVKQELVDRGLEIVDATCPHVQRVHHLVNRLVDEEYQVVIVGDSHHPEVIGIMGAIGGKGLVVGRPEDLEGHQLHKVGVVAQTTQSADNLQACVARLLVMAREIRVFPTICQATSQRQAATRELCADVDAMLVVGGRNSANTSRLAEICQEESLPVYHIESAEEIRREWFTPEMTVGVTAGASTPNWIIEGVVERMNEMFEEKKDQGLTEEQVQAEPVEAPKAPVKDAAVDSQEELMKNYEKSLDKLAQGSLVQGKVVEVRDDEVLVDVGYKSEGIIPKRELSHRAIESCHDLVAVDDVLEVVVDRVEDGEGNVVLSRRKAEAAKAWKELEALKAQDGVLEATVTERVKGGLLVDVGVRGFVPASHVSRQYVEDLDQYIGKTLKLKVLELERGRNNVVLSHRMVEEATYEEAKGEAFANLEAGSVVEGEVKRITNFGAFVDIGHGVEGLLHVSEMAWSRVNHPSDVVSEGDKIKVKILNIDRDNEKISLGLKQTKADPWTTVADRYKEGVEVNGVVTRVVDFGAFVKLEDGIEGLVHISQLASHHVVNPEEVVSPGDEVKVRVVNVDPGARRIGLSMKSETPSFGGGGGPAPSGGGRKNRAPKEPKEYVEDAGGGITIGDLIGDFFEKKGEGK